MFARIKRELRDIYGGLQFFLLCMTPIIVLVSPFVIPALIALLAFAVGYNVGAHSAH